MSISTLKWPVLARIAPSFIAARCSRAITLLSPVAVMKMSPIAGRLAIGITSKPSIAASSARIGSTSVTITCAPMPAWRASRRHGRTSRSRRRRRVLPASRTFVARMMPSIVSAPCRSGCRTGASFSASLTAMIGNRACRPPPAPCRRMTPVVVSSVPPMTSPSCSRRSEWRTRDRRRRRRPSSAAACGRAPRRCAGSTCRCPRP